MLAGLTFLNNIPCCGKYKNYQVSEYEKSAKDKSMSHPAEAFLQQQSIELAAARS
ncbi:MAG: hypothetical protein KME18_19110 [Phormidium tanganyikae FI6-MK23]|jgi:hypothetical protein|nr:hypothetical protein [Phormidium tanganyikae FI6-MK23]